MKKFVFSPLFFHLLVVLVINRLDNYLSIFIHPQLDNFCKIYYVDDSRFVMVGIAEILKLAKYKQPLCRPLPYFRSDERQAARQQRQ